MIGMQVSVRPAPDASPQLIAANAILHLSTLELEQAITRELDENPALEMVEQNDGSTYDSRSAPDYGIHSSANKYETPTSRVSFNDLDEARLEETDPLAFVQAPLTLAEQLFGQLKLLLTHQDYGIALYVVGNLDEHGYLTTSIEDLTQTLHCDTSRINAVVQELQSLEPAGIGARNLRECLLLQLDRLIETGIQPPSSTRTIIERYLTELGHHQFESIRLALHVPRTEVEACFLFIRTNLHPYPAYHYWATRDTSPSGAALPVPSVIIHRSSSSACGYDVEVIESQRSLLRLNPLYQQIRQQSGLTLSPAEREHISQYIERARLFMSHIQRRTLLLQRVMMYLVDYQRDFLDHGPSHLHPLSQKMVAQALGVHVSMISRAIAGKYTQLPSQKLLPLHRFFCGTVGTQELIRQIIADESEPLSDARIAKLLSERHSISLTRQMVANYRIELHIPTARQRMVLRRMQGSSDERQCSTTSPAYLANR
ncbi:RNA polymerase sigma-54 factor [Reticulibacter mediterranei]|uniref:RNA polymerase sigma-54 factor n=1 Tax=Reticulibacter mediterranei TaxID=2778369 RepID=A0A8J3IRP7_9CHLR|nr:hypothetical protein [Reticulibacter mediterranei]GHO99093.1 RNA polymerase sigma-54 factor [Reticulibacter mediterranei]